MASGERTSTPANPNAALKATWYGHVHSTTDALILFEACLSGQLLHCARRPHDRERESLIVSGNVFIYEEHSSGIKRWTDGYNWSPSRILNNFLIYRELEKAFPPGEKKKALKKKSSSLGKNGIVKTEAASRSNSVGNATAAMSAMSQAPDESLQNHDRALIGSLVDSYPFKDQGLVKKTISVSVNGVPHHLVSYYNVNDIKEGRLPRPSLCPPSLPWPIHIRDELILNQNFRVAVDHEEHINAQQGDGHWLQHATGHGYGLPLAGQVHMQPQDWPSQRSYSVPSIPQPGLGYALGHNQYQAPPTGLPTHTLSSYETQNTNGFFQPPAPHGLQDYSLVDHRSNDSMHSHNMHVQQPMPQLVNDLPEMFQHHQRRNTVHVPTAGLEASDFALPVSMAMTAAEPRAFSNHATPFIRPVTTGVNMGHTGMLPVSPLEGDMFYPHGQPGLMGSGDSTQQATPTLATHDSNFHLNTNNRPAWTFEDSFGDAFQLTNNASGNTNGIINGNVNAGGANSNAHGMINSTANGIDNGDGDGAGSG